MKKNKKGFTLAETMIVLVVLGFIATLTVPNLINKQKETTQRTKVKKAMAVYEEAVNKMLLENDRSFDNINAIGCERKTAYFKYIKRDTANTCIFQTPDKLWWDISDIGRPMIAFEQSNLTVQTANAADNKAAFVMVGRIDEQGIIRVDDLGYETQHSVKDTNNYESKAQLEKLYGFINKVEGTSGDGGNAESSFIDRCTTEDDIHYNCNGTIYTKKTVKEDVSVEGGGYCIWNSETKQETCPYTSTAEAGDYYFTEPATLSDYQSYEDEVSAKCDWCKEVGEPDYHNAAERYCNDLGGRLPTIAELQAGGYTSGDFWASEMCGSDCAIGFYNGGPYNGYEYNDLNVVCVGK